MPSVALFTALREAVLVVDAKGRPAQIGISSFFYPTSSIFANRTIGDIFPPAQANQILAGIRRALDTQGQANIKVELPDGEGRYRLSIAIAPISTQLVACVPQAASGNEEMRAFHDESERHFRQVARASFDGVAIYDRGIIIDVNEQLAAMFRYTVAEMVGQSTLALAAPASRETLIRNILTGAVQPFEATALRKDGTTFPVELRGRAMLYRGRRGGVAVVRDLSDRERATLSIRRNDERFRVLMGKNHDVIALVDSQAILQYISPSAEHVLGYTDQELVGHSAFRLVRPEDQTLVRQLFQGVASKPRNSTTAQVGIRHKDGSTRWVEAIGTNHLDDASIQGIVVNFRDISEQKEREKAIERHNLELDSLYKFSQVLQRHPSTAEILEHAYSIVGEVCDNRNLYIALYHPASESINFPIYSVDGERKPEVTRPFANGIPEHILRTRAPLWVPRDLDKAIGQMGIEPIGTPARSFLGVPMLADNQAIGVIAVQDFEKDDVYSYADVGLLSTIATQTAIALENQRLYDDTVRRADQFQALHETTFDLSTHGDLPNFFQGVLRRATALLNAPAGLIFLKDERTGNLVLSASIGISSAGGDGVPQHLGLAGLILETQTPQIIEDYSRWRGRLDQFFDVPLRALVGVPLLYRGEVFGVLEVGEQGESQRQFTPADARLLTLFGGQVASAVHNAQLVAHAQRRTNEFAALYDVTRDLSEFTDLPTLLQTILERAAKLMNAPSGTVTLYDSVSNELEIVAARQFPLSLGSRLKLGVGLSGTVALTRQPLVIDNYKDWENRLVELDSTPFAASVGVPLLYRGELIGTLALRETDPAARFTAADADLLSLFASQAASAVKNTRLYEETKTRADQMALLYDAGLTLNSTLDIRLQLEFLVKTAMKSVDADRAVFYKREHTQARAEFAIGYDEAMLNQLRQRVIQVGGERGIPGWVIQHQLPVNLRRVQDDPRYIQIDPAICAGLWVPVIHESMPRGVIAVLRTNDVPFSAQDERLLSLFANQVSVAMGNADIFSEINHRLVELQAINRLSTALRSAQTLNEMLPRFLDETLALFNTNTGVLRLFDPESNRLTDEITRGWLSEIPRSPLRPEEGMAGKAFSSGQVQLSREFRTDPNARPSALRHVPRGWGGACVPVRSTEGTVGVLVIGVELPRELNAQDARLLTTLAEIAGNTIQRMRLHESLHQTFLQTVSALAHAIDARDDYTGSHSARVSQLAVELAQELGMRGAELESIRLGGLLHDIGKIAIPDAILHKAESLTDSEWEIVKQHSDRGAKILEPIQQLKAVVPIVRHHQERYDGKGYPAGLAGESIPIGARILTVVDAFNAMIDNRPYRPAKSPRAAIQELEQFAGKQFDPNVVAAFRRMLERKRMLNGSR